MSDEWCILASHCLNAEKSYLLEEYRVKTSAVVLEEVLFYIMHLSTARIEVT